MGLQRVARGMVISPIRHEPPALFDRIWQEYITQGTTADRVAQHTTGRERFLKILEQYVRAANPPCVVEVGCGSAIDLCLLRICLPNGLAVGVDISWQGISVALHSSRQLNVPLSLCQGDAFSLPFRSGSAGVVFSQGVLEHFSDPRPALAEQVRILSPKGVLVVSVPQMFTGYTIHKRRAIRTGAWPWGWEDQYSSRRLRRLGDSLGLCLERCFGYQYWLSWGEPAWVLRDLVGKIERRSPALLRRLLRPVSVLYDRAWNSLEERYGHFFLQNIVAIFRIDRTRGENPAPH